jgi:hypothetical protein
MRSALGQHPMRLPGVEEIRMVRAIAHLALEEAARHREYRATFRGFHIHALRRRSMPGMDDRREVSLCVSFGRTLIARDLVATDLPGELEPIL